ncbi:hypothetical protein ACIKN0_10920, partial [Pediococcus acidilactici]
QGYKNGNQYQNKQKCRIRHFEKKPHQHTSFHAIVLYFGGCFHVGKAGNKMTARHRPPVC